MLFQHPRRPSRIAINLIVGLLATVLSGCATNINTDAPQRANAMLEKNDRDGWAPPNPYHDQAVRLWRDRPDYVALIDAPVVKRNRMISVAAPTYPLLLRLGHINGKVVVSFIVGIDGRVEDARIIESSDDRFNDSALEAMRKFTFLPAEGAHGPVREMHEQPFEFWWSPTARSEH